MMMSLYFTTRYHVISNLLAVYGSIEHTMASFHVTYGERKSIVTVEEQFTTDKLTECISKAFKLPPNAPMHLQMYNKTWDDWVDISLDDPEQLSNGGKLKLCVSPAAACATEEPGLTPAPESSGQASLSDFEMTTSTPQASVTR